MAYSKDISFHHGEQMATSRHNSIVEAAPLPDNKLVTSDATMRRLSATVFDLKDLTEAAKTATDADHHMGPLEAIKAYPKAVFFSVM
jgi:hypothetical protein